MICPVHRFELMGLNRVSLEARNPLRNQHLGIGILPINRIAQLFFWQLVPTYRHSDNAITAHEYHQSIHDR